MSKITNGGLTRSGTGCFIFVPIWQQWASMGLTLSLAIVPGRACDVGGVSGVCRRVCEWTPRRCRAGVRVSAASSHVLWSLTDERSFPAKTSALPSTSRTPVAKRSRLPMSPWHRYGHAADGATGRGSGGYVPPHFLKIWGRNNSSKFA